MTYWSVSPYFLIPFLDDDASHALTPQLSAVCETCVILGRLLLPWWHVSGWQLKEKKELRYKGEPQVLPT